MKFSEAVRIPVRLILTILAVDINVVRVGVRVLCVCGGGQVPIEGGVQLELPFSMSSLPARVLTRMTVTLHIGSRQFNVSRRFERVPPPQSAAMPSSVDYR